MERLVLLIIAAIGLHTAFVLYMADVRPVDQKTSTARSAPSASTSEVTAVRPAVDAEVSTSIPLPASDSPGAALIARNTDPVKSRTPRASATARVGVQDQRRPRLSGVAKQHHANASPKSSRPAK